MAEMKKSRAFMSLLLSILLLISVVGCNRGEIEGTEQILNPDIGLRGGLLIAGKNAEAMKPEIKSAAYLALDDVGKKLYDSAYTALAANENTFKLTGIDLKPYGEAYAYALTLFINEHPEFFWLDGYVEVSTERMSSSNIGNMTVVLGVYSYWSENDIVKAQNELDKAVASIVSQASTLKDDYEKVKFVHDYIIEFNSYDYEAYELGEAIDAQTDALVSSAYGALVSGKIMCAGYAKAFDLLMQELGIESFFVSGVADGGSHAWNLVKIGDGYYHIDLTWDDLDGSPTEVRYDYFCLTDEEIAKTHTADEGTLYPEANATEYNYFVKEKMLLDYYSFAAVNKLARNYDGKGVFAFKCYDTKVLKDAVKELVENNMIFKIEQFENVNSFQYIADETSNILSFYFE